MSGSMEPDNKLVATSVACASVVPAEDAKAPLVGHVGPYRACVFFGQEMASLNSSRP